MSEFLTSDERFPKEENEDVQVAAGNYETTSADGTEEGEVKDRDQSDRLHALAAEIRDQDELERNIGQQVGLFPIYNACARTNAFGKAEQLLAERANERERKRLDRALAEKE